MAERWLVLHAGALGDLVLTLQLARRVPAIARSRDVLLVSRINPGDLRGRWPALARRSSDGLGAHWLHATDAGPPPETLRQLFAGRAVLNALSGADSEIHGRLKTLSGGMVYSFDPRPQTRLETHIISQWQRQLERQGMLLDKCIHRRPGRSSARRPSDSTILLHPGSGGRRKCWPLASFLEVGRRLGQASRPIRFLLGPVEQETWPAGEIAAIRSEFETLSPAGADELGLLLSKAALLIGNDSGVSHLAALLGTQTLTLFGPTRGSIWRPLGPRAAFIQGDATSDPASWAIDPSRVVALAKERIGHGSAGQPRPLV